MQEPCVGAQRDWREKRAQAQGICRKPIARCGSIVVKLSLGVREMWKCRRGDVW